MESLAELIHKAKIDCMRLEAKPLKDYKADYEKRKEYIKAYRKEWRLKNLDYHRQKQKEYYERNRDDILAKNRLRYEVDPDYRKKVLDSRAKYEVKRNLHKKQLTAKIGKISRDTIMG